MVISAFVSYKEVRVHAHVRVKSISSKRNWKFFSSGRIKGSDYRKREMFRGGKVSRMTQIRIPVEKF